MSDEVVAQLLERISALEDKHELIERFEPTYVLLTILFIFLMQLGFAFLEAGAVHSTNVKAIIQKNVADTCIGSLVWIMWGSWIALDSEDSNVVLGYHGDGGQNLLESLRLFVFGNAMVTIISGAMASRLRFSAYMCIAVLVCGLLFPFPARWVWSDKGMFNVSNKESEISFVDFAGGSLVHSIGGICALVGAWVIGPRHRRFAMDSSGRLITKTHIGHDFVTSSIGIYCLWIGWVGFNAGSLSSAQGDKAAVVGAAIVNSIVCGSASFLTTCGIVYLRTGRFNVWMNLNGLLAGLVTVTSCAGLVQPYAALILGAVVPVVLLLSSRLVCWFLSHPLFFISFLFISFFFFQFYFLLPRFSLCLCFISYPPAPFSLYLTLLSPPLQLLTHIYALSHCNNFSWTAFTLMMSCTPSLFMGRVVYSVL